MRRNILITGATGKQGNALIRALTSESSPDSPHQYHIYALTRTKSSTKAHRLALEKRVTVVEGNLDVPDSISKIFEAAKSEGGIWGVYAVLAYPGLGQPAEMEERQGKV
jgi:nucleoside-diphosphate-sugar epimerase